MVRCGNRLSIAGVNEDVTIAPTLRVLLAGLHSMDVLAIRPLLIRAGVERVTSCAMEELTDAVQVENPDVVFLRSESTGIADACYQLKRDRPRTRVLAMAWPEGQADLFELRLVGANIGYRGLRGLLEMIGELHSEGAEPSEGSA